MLTVSNPAQLTITVDSLRVADYHMHQALDSLKNQSLVLSTKAENLDKIVYIQITAFVLIVTLVVTIAGLLSWKWITYYLKKRDDELLAKIKQYGEENKVLIAQVSEENEQTKVKLITTGRAASVSLYLAFKELGWHTSAIKKLFDIILFDLEMHKTEDFNELIDFIDQLLKIVTKKELEEDNWGKGFIETISKVKAAITDLKLIERFDKLEKDINKILYSGD